MVNTNAMWSEMSDATEATGNEREYTWACKCPGGFNIHPWTHLECLRCGMETPRMPPGIALMRYHRRIAGINNGVEGRPPGVPDR